eukprot:6325799-Pyramimonas_sp.AAC.1
METAAPRLYYYGPVLPGHRLQVRGIVHQRVLMPCRAAAEQAAPTCSRPTPPLACPSRLLTPTLV